MKPYYEERGITIWNCDCREILGELSAESIITDPVWPNCEHIFPGIDAGALLAEALARADVARVVLHLGCHSDPRFLAAVPAKWKFFRVCWLEYAVPSYHGRVLNGSDVAYAFGGAPASAEGARVIPGRVTSAQVAPWTRGVGRNKDAVRGADGKQIRDMRELLPHPSMRHIKHVRWLCKWFGGASVIDPFAGSFTCAVACKALGIPFTGIEINEAYCELGVRRLRQEVFDFQAVAL